MPNYYFIASLLNGYVGRIEHNSADKHPPLNAYPPKRSGTQNQLWKFVASDAPDYSSFGARLTNMSSTWTAPRRRGAGLQAYPKKSSRIDNRLWKFVLSSIQG
jgi:hypothetical protein